MPPSSPVPEIPLASRPRDFDWYALRRSKQREIQTKMAHMRAEREFLNARCDEIDARVSRIEMLYRTMFPNNRTDFGTPEVPQASQASQAPQAQQASEAMMEPPSLVLHLLDNM